MSEFGVTVSLKPHTGYDSPMLVFKGSDAIEVEEHLLAFFGLSDSGAGDTVIETVAQCDALSKAVYALQRELGATPVAKDQKGGARPTKAPVAPAKHPHEAVLQGIADANSTGEIARLYATNKAAWAHPDVSQAAKSRAEELS